MATRRHPLSIFGCPIKNPYAAGTRAVMTDERERDGAECQRVRSALASGRDEVDWDQIEQHLASCNACAPGLHRLTLAIQEQFAASRSLEAADGEQRLDPVRPGTVALEGETHNGQGRLIPFSAAARDKAA